MKRDHNPSREGKVGFCKLGALGTENVTGSGAGFGLKVGIFGGSGRDRDSAKVESLILKPA